MRAKSKGHGGFSLIELVIVVVIIAIIGAIAIPRMSRGAAGAADSALVGNLTTLRKSIDLYATEHGGTFPALATITNQLTLFSDQNGNTQATKDTTFIYGPYIRSIPTQPLGANKGNNTFTDTAGTAGAGWVYDATSGKVTANTTTETDAKGVAYSTY